MVTSTSSFYSVLQGLNSGDQEAARRIYQRFVDQLIHLATSRLDAKHGAKADPESVAQSVFQSFFERQQKDEFSLHNWGMVYGLLSHITLCKCINRNRDLRRQKRNASNDVTFEDWQQAARGPGPDEEVMVGELLTQALQSFDEDQRKVIDCFLQGATTENVAVQLGFSTRTVQRILEQFRKRLLAMMEVD